MNPKLNQTKNTVLILGPSLNAVSGVSTHLRQLFSSDLISSFELLHYQVGSEGRKESMIGRITRLLLDPLQFAKALIRTKAMLVHINTSFDRNAFWRDAGYVLTAKLLRRKILYQVHGGPVISEFSKSGGLTQCVARKMILYSDLVVLLSKTHLTDYRAFIPTGKFVVIENAIDLSKFLAESSFVSRENSIRALYMGRLAENKGILEAIKGIATLKHRAVLGDFKFIIAGSGPAEEKIRYVISTQKLSDIVELVGPIFGEEKYQLWTDADIFLFPTYHHEGLPYSVLEALASGTPMVVSRMGGIPDVIDNHVHGIIVEPHNPTDVANAIEWLIADRARLATMKRECVRRAHEFYGLERMAREFSDIYNALT